MTRTTRHHLTSTAILLTSALLVGGCTGDDAEPEASSSELPLPASVTASPSDEPSPTASPSPSGPEKPERPAAMDKKDGDGAAAATSYFFELQQHMFLTGETDEYSAMSHQACDYCATMLENAEWLASSQSTYEGGARSVEVVQIYTRDAVTAVTPVDIKLTTEAVVIRDSSGHEVENLPAETVEIRAELGQRDGEWVVVGMPPVPKGG